MLKDIIRIIKKYFLKLIESFEGLIDMRHQLCVTYKMKIMFMVRLLGLMCEIKSMNELTREINTKEAIENIVQICNLELEEILHNNTRR